MVFKMSGKYSNTKIHHLDVIGVEVTDIPEIANSFAQTFPKTLLHNSVRKTLIHTSARLKIIYYLSNPKIWKHIITLFQWMNLHLQYQNLMTPL